MEKGITKLLRGSCINIYMAFLEVPKKPPSEIKFSGYEIRRSIVCLNWSITQSVCLLLRNGSRRKLMRGGGYYLYILATRIKLADLSESSSLSLRILMFTSRPINDVMTRYVICLSGRGYYTHGSLVRLWNIVIPWFLETKGFFSLFSYFSHSSSSPLLLLSNKNVPPFSYKAGRRRRIIQITRLY